MERGKSATFEKKLTRSFFKIKVFRVVRGREGGRSLCKSLRKKKGGRGEVAFFESV